MSQNIRHKKEIENAKISILPGVDLLKMEWKILKKLKKIL